MELSRTGARHGHLPEADPGGDPLDAGRFFRRGSLELPVRDPGFLTAECPNLDSIGADACPVSYKTGNEEYSVTYDKADEISAKWIITDGDLVTIIIDSEYLQEKNSWRK